MAFTAAFFDFGVTFAADDNDAMDDDDDDDDDNDLEPGSSFRFLLFARVRPDIRSDQGCFNFAMCGTVRTVPITFVRWT